VITARINARLNGAQIRAIRGDLFGPARGQRFDLIVSNPPYLPSRGRPRPHSAALAWDAGPSGRALLDRICGEVAAHLRPGGVLLLVQSSVSGEQETVRALTAAGLQTAVIDRRPGPLGPRLRARAAELRDRGLLREDGWEEMLVIRAVSSDSGGS
jgi:release factor glutamine methyltransferase